MVGRPSQAGLARRRRREGDTAYLSSGGWRTLAVVPTPGLITATPANIPKRGLVQPWSRARIRRGLHPGGVRPQLGVARGSARAGARKGADAVPEPSPPTVPPPGAALLEQLLTALADRVPGTLGAAVAVPAGQPEHPDVLGAGGTVAPWLPAALAAALRRREPVLVAEEDGGVLAVVDGPEPTGPGVAVGIVLDRAPGPADADLAAAALPVIASAVAVLQEWAAETERAEQMVQMVQYRRV